MIGVLLPAIAGMSQLDIMDSAALLGDIRESLAELSATAAPVLSREDALPIIGSVLLDKFQRLAE